MATSHLEENGRKHSHTPRESQISREEMVLTTLQRAAIEETGSPRQRIRCLSWTLIFFKFMTDFELEVLEALDGSKPHHR